MSLSGGCTGPGCPFDPRAHLSSRELATACRLCERPRKDAALSSPRLPHTGYCGDTLLGHHAHFGCGAVTANFPLFAGSRPAITLRGARYDLGRRKFGAVLGDYCQLGCGSVTEPGCLLAPNTHAYPLSRLPRGVYGPRELLKNRPRIERAPLR